LLFAAERTANDPLRTFREVIGSAYDEGASVFRGYN